MLLLWASWKQVVNNVRSRWGTYSLFLLDWVFISRFFALSVPLKMNQYCDEVVKFYQCNWLPVIYCLLLGVALSELQSFWSVIFFFPVVVWTWNSGITFLMTNNYKKVNLQHQNYQNLRILLLQLLHLKKKRLACVYFCLLPFSWLGTSIIVFKGSLFFFWKSFNVASACRILFWILHQRNPIGTSGGMCRRS